MILAQSCHGARCAVDMFYVNRCDFGSPVSGFLSAKALLRGQAYH